MAEKPILFNTEMVRAILDSRKRVTRRVCKGQPQGGINSPEMLGYEPPYKPGDILWVRETWDRYVDGNTGETVYVFKTHSRARKILEEVGGYQIKWRPSIHMPKDAARIFLKVKSVRSGRLQEYFDASCAHAEGIIIDRPHSCQEAVDAFVKLWNSTIKPAELPRYGWEANPWVWVIAFERIDKPKGWCES